MKTVASARREFLKQSGALVVGFSLASAGAHNNWRRGPRYRGV